MDFANPSSSSCTLGDFLPSSLQGGLGSEARDAPLVNERNFLALGGGRRGTSNRDRGGGGNRLHRSRSRPRRVSLTRTLLSLRLLCSQLHGQRGAQVPRHGLLVPLVSLNR